MKLTKEDILVEWEEEYYDTEEYAESNRGDFRRSGDPWKKDYDSEKRNYANDKARRTLCKNGEHLSDYEDDDEFYVNAYVQDIYPAAYAEEHYYNLEAALEYIEDRNEWNALFDYIYQDFIMYELKRGKCYFTTDEEIQQGIRDFVFEDYNDYMEFLMGE